MERVEVHCTHCETAAAVRLALLETSVVCEVCGRTFVAQRPVHERALRVDTLTDTDATIELDTADDPVATWYCFQCQSLISAELDVCPTCGITPAGDVVGVPGNDVARRERRRLRLLREQRKREKQRMAAKGAMIVCLLLFLQSAGLLFFAPALAVGGMVFWPVVMHLITKLYHGEMQIQDMLFVAMLDALFIGTLVLFVATWGIAGFVLGIVVGVLPFIGLVRMNTL